jgi:hypothetical protein
VDGELRKAAEVVDEIEVASLLKNKASSVVDAAVNCFLGIGGSEK